MACHRKPSLMWSGDHGTNFVGANRELQELFEFLEQQKSKKVMSEFKMSNGVLSQKTHLRKVTSDIKLTYEEYSTVLCQIESCLNSRPLVPLTGHFLIGRPLESIPDPSFTYRSVSILRRWHLVQSIVRQFWNRWSTEYLFELRKYTKWHHPTRNVRVGDVVVLHEDSLVRHSQECWTYNVVEIMLFVLSPLKVYTRDL